MHGKQWKKLDCLFSFLVFFFSLFFCDEWYCIDKFISFRFYKCVLFCHFKMSCMWMYPFILSAFFFVFFLLLLCYFATESMCFIFLVCQPITCNSYSLHLEYSCLRSQLFSSYFYFMFRSIQFWLHWWYSLHLCVFAWLTI